MILTVISVIYTLLSPILCLKISNMNISEFNINAEFIACNHITTNELNPLVEKPYHTKASIFALCTKGVLKTIINHTQFRVEANTLLVIPPETFVQLLHTSDDAEIYVVIFPNNLSKVQGPASS